MVDRIRKMRTKGSNRAQNQAYQRLTTLHHLLTVLCFSTGVVQSVPAMNVLDEACFGVPTDILQTLSPQVQAVVSRLLDHEAEAADLSVPHPVQCCPDGF